MLKANDLGLYCLIKIIPLHETLSKLFKEIEIDIIIHANIIPSYIVLKIAKKYKIPSIYDYLDHFPESSTTYYSNPVLKKLAYDFALQTIKYNLEMSTHIVNICLPTPKVKLVPQSSTVVSKFP